MIKVKIKKVHPSWNTCYPNEFVVGDIVELTGGLVVTKNKRKFLADMLCQSFGNTCSYADIFEKLEEQ